MAAAGSNEGIRVLDEFVCDALHEGAAPGTMAARQAQNEGLLVSEELVIDPEAAHPDNNIGQGKPGRTTMPTERQKDE